MWMVDTQATLSEMTNTQQQIASQIRENTTEYEQLRARMRQLRTDVDDMKFDKSNTESQLQSVTQSLKGKVPLCSASKELSEKKCSTSG